MGKRHLRAPLPSEKGKDMERLAASSTGTKLTLASGVLLFFDLFFTWQNLPQHFGTKFAVTANLDGWDQLGLVLGLVTLGLLALVVLRTIEVELPPDVPWNRITLGLAAAAFAVAVLKNATDTHSAWAAYAGVVLAAGMLAGALLDRDRLEPEPKPIQPGKWRPRARAATSPTASNGSQALTGAREREARRAKPAGRW
jgi:hypothetical protein